MRKHLILLSACTVLAAIACGNDDTNGKPLARIDGEVFTDADFALRLGTLEPAQRNALLEDTAQRRNEFNKLLRTRLFALAGQESRFGKDETYRRRLASIGQRVLTQYYFDAHLTAHGGIPPGEIASFYAENQSRFADESGNAPPLEEISARVADTIIVSGADLDSFFRERKETYLRRATAKVSLIRTDTRQEAEQARKALRGGTPFAEVAARFSNHSSKDDGGNVGQVTQGLYHAAIGSQVLGDSLFFDKGSRMEPGKFSDILENSGQFRIFRLDSRVEESYSDPADIRQKLAGDYLRIHKDKLHRDAVEKLKEEYGVRLISPDRTPEEKDLRAYYKENPESYTSPETFELYHIETSDRATLEAEMAGISSLADFREAASRLSENSLTKKQEGYLGIVKRDFSLPYGIGTLPALFTVLDETGKGLVERPLHNPASRKWHAFWVTKKEPGRLKPYDRVRALIAKDYGENLVVEITPRDTLAVIEKLGEPVLEEAVVFLRNEIPAPSRDMYTRENLVDYLIVWRIFSSEARALNLHRQPRARALLLQAEDNYWSRLYRDSILARTYEESQRRLAKTFRSNRELFPKRTSDEDGVEDHARDIAGFLRLTPRDFEIEYHTNPEHYMRDTVPMSLEEARPTIFQRLRPVAHARLDEHVLDKLKKRFRVRILDESLKKPALGSPEKAYARAQQLHFDRSLDEAMNLYRRMREEYPERAGLQDSVSFAIAQLHVEQQRYQRAMAEYRRVTYLRPDSPDAYKAVFMVGFIQAEYLKRDEDAVRTFETMLEKYPDSDLGEDADWMIRNIRSGGQLMPDLEDDFEDWDEDAEE